MFTSSFNEITTVSWEKGGEEGGGGGGRSSALYFKGFWSDI
jgi:hypothetical protein